jgi:adenosylcobinamide-GDP ribazoletransferase
MRGLLSALGFLTILPAGKRTAFDPAAMIPFFPVVGLILGALAALFDRLVFGIWPAPAAALLDVLLLALLTGALHLDGLGDTADGLFSHRSRERALEIMKDSRVGMMGLVAVVFALGLKWAGLASLESHRGMILLLVPAYARAGMLFAIRFLPYGRPGGGTGHDFFDAPLQWRAFWAVPVLMVLSLGAGAAALRLIVGFAAITAGLIIFYRKRMGCVTGDMLGAMTETIEAGLFLLAAAGAGT